MSIKPLLQQRLESAITSISSLRGCIDQIESLSSALTQVLRNGGTVYTAGNGGSAAQALHLAEELIGRYRSNRAPLRAVCLNADPTALTCIANDFGFDHVFSRQCEALLAPTDLLIVLSTSGNSANLVNALKTARNRGAQTIGLLGRVGGACLPLCDLSLVVGPPHADSASIQEAHQVLIHLLCEAAEAAFPA